MKCGTVLAQLTALIDGELTREGAERVRAHLTECAVCNDAAAETASLKQLAGAWTATGADVWQAVREEVEGSDMKVIAASLRALAVEVRELRAEVYALRARVERADIHGDLFGPLGRLPASRTDGRYLRIV